MLPRLTSEAPPISLLFEARLNDVDRSFGLDAQTAKDGQPFDGDGYFVVSRVLPSFRSASTIFTVVFSSESGFNEMLLIPCSTRNWANSG